MKKIILFTILFATNFVTHASEPDKIPDIKNTYPKNLFTSGYGKLGNAHIVSLEFGKNISTFDYKNSNGESLENLENQTNNHLRLGWRMHFQTSKHYILSGIAYKKYGSKGSDPSLGNYFDWDVNYLGINVGVGYEFFKLKSFFNYPYGKGDQGITSFIQASVNSDFFIQGTQTINNNVYDLKGVEQFDKPFISANIGVGVAYYVSKSISFNGIYNYNQSFSVFKSDSNDQEVLNYIVHSFSLGISISLPLM